MINAQHLLSKWWIMDAHLVVSWYSAWSNHSSLKQSEYMSNCNLFHSTAVYHQNVMRRQTIMSWNTALLYWGMPSAIRVNTSILHFGSKSLHARTHTKWILQLWIEIFNAFYRQIISSCSSWCSNACQSLQNVWSCVLPPESVVICCGFRMATVFFLHANSHVEDKLNHKQMLQATANNNPAQWPIDC